MNNDLQREFNWTGAQGKKAFKKLLLCDILQRKYIISFIYCLNMLCLMGAYGFNEKTGSLLPLSATTSVTFCCEIINNYCLVLIDSLVTWQPVTVVSASEMACRKWASPTNSPNCLVKLRIKWSGNGHLPPTVRSRGWLLQLEPLETSLNNWWMCCWWRCYNAVIFLLCCCQMFT